MMHGIYGESILIQRETHRLVDFTPRMAIG